MSKIEDIPAVTLLASVLTADYAVLKHAFHDVLNPPRNSHSDVVEGFLLEEVVYLKGNEARESRIFDVVPARVYLGF